MMSYRNRGMSLWVGLLVCLATAPGALRAQGSPADSAAVVETVRGFHAALAAADSARALGLLAEDAVVLESGVLETRDEYRAHHLTADIEFARSMTAQREIVRVTVRGDVAWIASRSDVSGTFRGRSVEASGAELMVLTREARGWRIRAIHWSSRSKE